MVTSNTICCMKEESLWKAPAPTSVEAAYGANNTKSVYTSTPKADFTSRFSLIQYGFLLVSIIRLKTEMSKTYTKYK